jgi:septum site-determining protein MinC
VDPQTPPGNDDIRQFGLWTLVPEAPVFAWLSRLDDAPPPDGGLVVLDLSRTRLNGPGLRALVQEMLARDIRVAGLVGLEASQLGDQAGQLPPILPASRPANAIPPPIPPALIPPVPIPPAPAIPAGLLIDGNVRSGQRVVHPHGDVTIIGTVSSGAEIVAGGSVHIHGTLRGRVTAGQGGAPAHIFCQRLEAEMLAIDGIVLVADDMNPQLLGSAILATADGDRLRLRALT